MGTDKDFGTDAAKAGLFLGLLQFCFNAIPAVLKLNEDQAGYVSWVGIVALGVAIYFFGKRRADKKAELGNTFGEAFAFTIVAMLYTGVISGLGSYMIYNHIAPEYSEAILRKSMALLETQLGGIYSDSNVVDTAISLMTNPIVMVINGIFGMVFGGGVLGLFISPFLKRELNPFEEKNEE